MTAHGDRCETEHFRSAVARRLGLQFDDAKLGWLEEVLGRRIEATGMARSAYVARLGTETSLEELGALARELTVTETYFFRNVEQIRALIEHVVPELLGAQTVRRPLRILSAGCASGEEPYTIAIALREAAISCDVSIVAVDLNPAMLEKATQARYSSWALRETPSELARKWFVAAGRESILDGAIKSAVRFRQSNLADVDAELWRPASWDVVFCRNVIMYFAPKTARDVVSRIARSLTPGGYLFLGHAETLRGLSQDFHLRHTHETFYYRRRDSIGDPESAAPRHAAADTTVSTSAIEAAVDGSQSWVEAIRAASERIRSLSQTSADVGVAAPPGWDLGHALELLREERFAEALDVVGAFPPESARDRDVLLVEAALLAHRGDLDRAEATCRRLLHIDELSAGAHYVLALCREGAGDNLGATEHDQTASYLDPAFAMPRLHLGLLARRGGDLVGARRELAQALVLLEREDVSRLLLFGGGFGREALAALCRAELRACGGAT